MDTVLLYSTESESILHEEINQSGYFKYTNANREFEVHFIYSFFSGWRDYDEDSNNILTSLPPSGCEGCNAQDRLYVVYRQDGSIYASGTYYWCPVGRRPNFIGMELDSKECTHFINSVYNATGNEDGLMPRPESCPSGINIYISNPCKSGEIQQWLERPCPTYIQDNKCVCCEKPTSAPIAYKVTIDKLHYPKFWRKPPKVWYNPMGVGTCWGVRVKLRRARKRGALRNKTRVLRIPSRVLRKSGSASNLAAGKLVRVD